MTEAIATTPLRMIFRFPFRGPNWFGQFAIGSALIFASTFIPIVPTLFVYGYVLRVMRQAIDGQDLVLPAWDNWGKLGMDGLRAMLVSLAYLLPGILALGGGITLYFVSVIAFSAAAEAAEQVGETPGLMASLGFMAGLVIFFFSLAAGPILLLLGAIPLPVATAHFAARDKAEAAFRLREWWPFLRVNKLGYFIDWVIFAGLVYILSFALTVAYYSIVLCCLIPVLIAPIGFYMSLVSAALFGQTYRESGALLSASDRAVMPATQ